ncbi:13594_t:CDS:2 [Entrophospora sp. SA101]|nr:13594_t:CDS:2 [Entrophospora sp. SA101]
MATRIYIGRLSRDARERDVEKLFRGYGSIREIKLMNGFGFVEFRDHRDADDVVYAFNGKSFMGEKGERRRHDRDDRRDRDRDDHDRDRGRFAPPQRNPQCRLIVENLSSSCSWQDLKDLMRKAGEVTFADCHKDRIGEGVVEFSSYDDMKNAIRKLDNVELKGKRIILHEASNNDSDHNYDRDYRRRSRSPHPRHSRRHHSPSRSPRHRHSDSRSRSPSDNGKDNNNSRSRTRSRSSSPPPPNENGNEKGNVNDDKNVNDDGNLNDDKNGNGDRNGNDESHNSPKQSPSKSEEHIVQDDDEK